MDFIEADPKINTYSFFMISFFLILKKGIHGFYLYKHNLDVHKQDKALATHQRLKK